MRQSAFEVVEPFNLRPLPLVDDSGAIDKHVAGSGERRPILPGQVDLPVSFFLVPRGGGNRGVELDILLHAVLAGKLDKVLLDLVAVAVIAAPLGIRLEGERICVCRDVARTPGVPVLVPSAPDGIVLLVADEFVVGQGLLRPVRKQQTRGAGPDVDDPQGLWRALRIVGDVVRRVRNLIDQRHDDRRAAPPELTS